jgi:hypothetical protein
MDEICSGRNSSGRLTRTLRNVVLLRPVKASASERAEPTTAPPSNGIASRAAKTADFVRNLAEGVLLCFAEVAFAAFAINVDEVNGVEFWNVEINHPCSATLADTDRRESHAGLAEATASTHDISLLGLSGEVELEVDVVIVRKPEDRSRELRRFDKYHMTG